MLNRCFFKDGNHTAGLLVRFYTFFPHVRLPQCLHFLIPLSLPRSNLSVSTSLSLHLFYNLSLLTFSLCTFGFLLPLSELWAACDRAPAGSVDLHPPSSMSSLSLSLSSPFFHFPPNFPLTRLAVCAPLISNSPFLSVFSFCLLQRRKWKTLTCPVSRKRLWGTSRLTASGAWANCWTASR